MSTYPEKHYGISCPPGGHFFLKPSSSTPFIGCCTADTITDSCPDKQVKPMAFDFSGDIPPQDCIDDDALWYTCSLTKPTFIGCCATNPCSEKGCPADKLRAARLSKDESRAKEFMGASVSSSTGMSSTTTTSSATSTSSATAATSAGPSVSSEPSTSGAHDLSPGSIAGIVVGSIAGVLGLGLLFFWIYRLAQKRSPVTWHASPTDDQFERKWTTATPTPLADSSPQSSPLPYVASAASSSMPNSPAAVHGSTIVSELPATPIRQVSSIVSSTWSQPSQTDVSGLYYPSQDHIRRYEGMSP